jgi:large subunit ribosomal protein L7/L12
MALNKEEILEAISQMTVLELSELIKAFEEKFGVTAAAPVAVASGVAAGPQEEVEEQTEFDVILTDVGAKKIDVLKVVREITALGLKEAKELVDTVPKPVKEKVKKEEAAEIKAKIEAAGGKVEVK